MKSYFNSICKLIEQENSPEMLTFFLHRFKYEILSNLIFKTKSNGIMFEWNFILKAMPPQKKVGILGENGEKTENQKPRISASSFIL